MTGWACGIGGCDAVFGDVESLLAHQATEHERHECGVCGTVVPDGFFAIRHMFDEHTRAEFVRAYDADSDDIREREDVKNRIEDEVEVAALRERLDL
ncbi:DUF7565 family protein [Salarchaeum japonicum]|uniref:DUF7565 family protein n=1 Tax=Salarchaeum japonicum TaxID=555573 RepID=UPI003C7101FD